MDNEIIKFNKTMNNKTDKVNLRFWDKKLFWDTTSNKTNKD